MELLVAVGPKQAVADLVLSWSWGLNEFLTGNALGTWPSQLSRNS